MTIKEVKVATGGNGQEQIKLKQRIVWKVSSTVLKNEPKARASLMRPKRARQRPPGKERVKPRTNK